MHRRVSDNALFPDVLLPSLKLRLDQAKHLSRRLQQLLDRRQHDPQRDERHIDHREVERFAEILRRHIADVRPLHYNDARVRADLPRQLPIAHIDGKYLTRPLLEQTIGKSARRRAGVAAHIARRVNAEVAQRLFELQSAAAHIRAHVPAHLDLGFKRDIHASLVGLLAVHIDLARHDDGLRPAAGLREPALHQQHVQPLLMLHARKPPRSVPSFHPRPVRPPAVRSRSRRA